ncbi:hypothetical protein J3459_007714 [Metarhizium acridum]|nr:hypothetical protein J3459_007714 [Metarhizium acridum]
MRLIGWWAGKAYCIYFERAAFLPPLSLYITFISSMTPSQWSSIRGMVCSLVCVALEKEKEKDQKGKIHQSSATSFARKCQRAKLELSLVLYCQKRTVAPSKRLL